MSESLESIILRMGLDQSQVEQGLLKMQARQEMAADKTKAIWAEADREMAAEHAALLAKEVEQEKAFNDTLVALHEKQLASKAAADKAWMEERAAMSVIASGSGGYGSGFVTAEQKAAGGIAKDVEISAAAAAGSAIGHKLSHGNQAGIIRESMVIIRESFRGMWSRVAGSASLLFQYLGITATTLLTAIPIIGTGMAGILANISMKRSLAEQAGGYGTVEGSKGTESIISKRLRDEIEKLRKGGKISSDEARGYINNLGSLSGIKSVQRDLAKYLPQGFDTEENEKKKKDEIARINAQARKDDLAADREKMSHLERIVSLGKDQSDLLEQMNKLDMDSVEYAKNKLDQAALLKQMDKERQDITKEAIELQKRYDEERKNIGRAYGSEAQMDVDVPTLSELAGRDFNKNLSDLYGPAKYRWFSRGRRTWSQQIGGQYDLEAGDGPFAQAAQQAELYSYQEKYDIIHGNAKFGYNPLTQKNELIGGQAFIDRQQRMAAENLLSQAGLDTPAMRMQKMNTDIADINRNIGDLLSAAKKDGIVLKDP